MSPEQRFALEKLDTPDGLLKAVLKVRRVVTWIPLGYCSISCGWPAAADPGGWIETRLRSTLTESSTYNAHFIVDRGQP